MQPNLYPLIHGNASHAAQPMALPYPMDLLQQSAYNTGDGVGQQQHPDVMLGHVRPLQANEEYNPATPYGYNQNNNSLQNSQLAPQAAVPNNVPVDPRLLRPAGVGGVGVPASAPPLLGGASGFQNPQDTSQMVGQGLGISEGFPCVRLRGLPFEATEQDVEGWLETEPLDIILVRRNGIATGEAYVLLRLPLQVEHVLSRHKTNLGTRYVEVALAKKLDFYREIYIMVRDDEDSKLAMRSQRSSREHGSRSRHDSPPRKRSSRRDSSSERGSKRRHRDEPRERDRIDAEPAERGERRGRPPVAEEDHTGVIKMRGLPFSTTAEEIVDWYRDAAPAITTDRVHVVMSRGNRPMGTAFVQFVCVKDAVSAMAMDRKTMGSRYIELFASNVGEAAAHGAPFT